MLDVLSPCAWQRLCRALSWVCVLLCPWYWVLREDSWTPVNATKTCNHGINFWCLKPPWTLLKREDIQSVVYSFNVTSNGPKTHVRVMFNRLGSFLSQINQASRMFRLFQLLFFAHSFWTRTMADIMVGIMTSSWSYWHIGHTADIDEQIIQVNILEINHTWSFVENRIM